MKILFCLVNVFTLYVQVSTSTRTSSFTSYNQSQVFMLPLGQEFSNVKRTTCAIRCLGTNSTCYSFVYNVLTRTCSLGSWLIPYNNTVTSESTKLYSTGKMCNNTTSASQTTCPDANCPENHVNIGNNPTFEPLKLNVYKSCRDVISNDTRKVVTLTSGLVVMCDTVTDGGGWTIFQRRVSGTVDFYRGWEEYKHGFGDYGIGEFYLGNENIFCLTSKAAHELRVDLVYNASYYAKYSNFQLLNEFQGYRLNISGYSGNSGDSMAEHNAQMFTTYDRDNDAHSTVNCAETYLGAWWYKACHQSNLNGKWRDVTYGEGLNWFTLTGYLENVIFSEIKMRII